MGVRCQMAGAQTGLVGEGWFMVWGQGARSFWTMGLRTPIWATTATMPPLAVVAMPQ